MKRFYLPAVLFLMLFIGAVRAEHIDKGDPEKNLQQVENSYCLLNEDKFESVVEKARNYADKHYIENGAIVSDIDETLLDNREYYKNFKLYTKENWEEWIARSESTLLTPAYEFLKWAKERGYKIFLITGRGEAYREATLKNLDKYKIPYDEIFFKPDDYDELTAVIYKTSIRKKLTDEGYKIIVNIGDQKSDIEGDYGKGFKLPNLIYTVP